MMKAMKLILENNDGKTVRTFHVEGEKAVVVSRRDTRRIELHPDTRALEAKKVKFETLGEIHSADLAKAPFSLGPFGQLKMVPAITSVVHDPQLEPEDRNKWLTSLAAMAVAQSLFFVFVLTRPTDSAKIEQEMKQQVVQIVKKIQVKKVQMKQVERPQTVTKTAQMRPSNRTVKTTSKTASVRRQGALAVFGSLSSGKNRGGVNLGAVNSSAGPGLGGTGGSGGVQSTLFGRGLVSAPLGAGGNMKGGGGYGTKGKGGGQAGYGKLSLVGSAGTATIPLGREALVEGGLDRDLIAEVIQRNMGQVRFCYEQGLQGQPGLAGRVAVGFTISGNGMVRVAGVESTTLHSRMVEECIVRRLKTWKFPLPEGGVDVRVSFPFVLRRAGQG
jgi:hypothetical protein